MNVGVWGTSEELHKEQLKTLSSCLRHSDTVIVTNGPDGITSHVTALAEYLLQFEHNHTLFMSERGILRWAGRTRDIGRHLMGTTLSANVLHNVYACLGLVDKGKKWMVASAKIRSVQKSLHRNL
jgi:hypothetical protein